MHCLDFRALKRRLIDDPPDPHDDHPSMSDFLVSVSTATTADIDGSSFGSASSAADGGGMQMEQQQRLLPLEDAEAGIDMGAGGEKEEQNSGRAWGAVEGGGGVSVLFSDPASRVFVFEIKQVCCVYKIAPIIHYTLYCCCSTFYPV